MSIPAANITTDRECDHCGYNLKGLPEGSKCPECGSSIRRTAVRTSGTMTDEAPTRFIRKLRLGFILASVAILGSIVLKFAHLGILASGLWVAGIWLVTLERPGAGRIRPDKVLDNKRLRDILRYACLAWPFYSLSYLAFVAVSSPAASGASTNAVGSAILIWVLGLITVLSGIVAWFSLIPTSIYFAEICYWASHDNLADRLRGAAWTLAVFGTIAAILGGLAVGAGSPVAFFIGVFFYIIVALALVVFGVTTIQIGSVLTWVIKHQTLAAGSAERIRQRVQRETSRPGHIATDMSCLACGYDLRGLPFGGECPECGESYADRTPMPTRDPARTPSYHDNTPLDIDETGENKGVFFNDQLDASGKPKPGGVPYTPQVEVPDEGDIPLSMDDQDAPPEEDEETRDA